MQHWTQQQHPLPLSDPPFHVELRSSWGQVRPALFMSRHDFRVTHAPLDIRFVSKGLSQETRGLGVVGGCVLGVMLSSSAGRQVIRDVELKYEEEKNKVYWSPAHASRSPTISHLLLYSLREICVRCHLWCLGSACIVWGCECALTVHERQPSSQFREWRWIGDGVLRERGSVQGSGM